MKGFHFTVTGPPRTKKNHGQTIVRGGRVFRLPSKPHEEWFALAMSQSPVIRAELRRQGVDLPITAPVRITAVFFRQANSGDLNGYEQALGDWLQTPVPFFGPKRSGIRNNGASIIVDDKQIVSWGESRLDVDRARPRIEVEIEVLPS